MSGSQPLFTSELAAYIISSRPNSSIAARNAALETLLSKLGIDQAQVRLNRYDRRGGPNSKVCIEHDILFQLLGLPIKVLIGRFLVNIKEHANEGCIYPRPMIDTNGLIAELANAHEYLRGVMGEVDPHDLEGLYSLADFSRPGMTGIEPLDCGDCSACKLGRILSDRYMVQALLIHSAARQNADINLINMLSTAYLGSAAFRGLQGYEAVNELNRMLGETRQTLIAIGKGDYAHNLA